MQKQSIRENMTVLDVVSWYEETVEVFRRYDASAGECICCNSLFDTIEAVARKYSLDIDELIRDLNDSLSDGRG